MSETKVSRRSSAFAFIGTSVLESASPGRWPRFMVATRTLMMPVGSIGGDGRLARKRLEFTMAPGEDAALVVAREVASAAVEAKFWHEEHPAWGPLNVVVPVGSVLDELQHSLEGAALVANWDVHDGFGGQMARAQYLAAGHLLEVVSKGKVVEESFDALLASLEREEAPQFPTFIPPPRGPNLGRDWWQPRR